MKRLLISFLTFALCSIHALAQQAATVPGEILVKIQPSYSPDKLVKEVYEFSGIESRFATGKCISNYMNIWLFTFDETALNKRRLLDFVRTVEGVSVAQANHVLEERVIPDDPFFSQQWHHQDAEDHDIDSDLAWDITTGGTTPTGDDIVVCIVEIGGTKWDTADIVDNHWVNIHEIPDNGIDDDENGYVDDYNGWNINTLNDALNTGDHGTRVSSMIGSTGNNSAGTTGVNWDVSMMQVQIGGSNEASAIAGYEYPFIMRKLYNETNGAKGAFVVATNSSWGTNNGQPDEAPLWCAMYDSLGHYGVLSCGATTNSNANVDVVGDLPTACPSDYMVSVGRTNNQDVRSSGGFGITTIDLMAPGDNVYLANNTVYGNTTGTSFSSPCVAGGIALLYSAPCNSLIQLAYLNPDETALVIKEYILAGIDTTTQLETECVSGGRFNVNNSLQLLLESCDNSSCIAPFGTVVSQVGSSLNYSFSWDALPGIDTYSVQYRITNTTEWTILNNITGNSFITDALSSCTEYELQILSECDDDQSNWSNPFIWTTDGCCVNPTEPQVISVIGNSVEINWETVLAADSYRMTATPESGDIIQIENINDSNYVLTGLQPCMRYTIEVLSNCDGDPGETEDFHIHTGGCENCNDLEYCDAGSNSNSEHIAQVTVGDINHISGNDGGYVLVTEATTVLNSGSTYTISCVPGFSGASYNENFQAWIDFNSDEDFEDPGELVFDAPAPSTTGVAGEFTVPPNVTPGVVRLRVGMRYTPSNSNVEPSDCGEWTFGEVEDYCVTLDGPVGIFEKKQQPFVVFPNPANDNFTLVTTAEFLNVPLQYRLINMHGQLIQSSQIFSGQTLDCSNLESGIYFIEIRSGENTSHVRLIKN
jgi:hypothetical protein